MMVMMMMMMEKCHECSDFSGLLQPLLRFCIVVFSYLSCVPNVCALTAQRRLRDFMVLSWPRPFWIVLLQISYLVKPNPFFIQVTSSEQEHSATRIIPFCISALSPPFWIPIPLFSTHEWAAQILRASYSTSVGAHKQVQLPCVIYHADTTASFELLFVPVPSPGADRTTGHPCFRHVCRHEGRSGFLGPTGSSFGSK